MNSGDGPHHHRKGAPPSPPPSNPWPRSLRRGTAPQPHDHRSDLRFKEGRDLGRRAWQQLQHEALLPVPAPGTQPRPPGGRRFPCRGRRRPCCRLPQCGDVLPPLQTPRPVRSRRPRAVTTAAPRRGARPGGAIERGSSRNGQPYGESIAAVAGGSANEAVLTAGVSAMTRPLSTPAASPGHECTWP